MTTRTALMAVSLALLVGCAHEVAQDELPLDEHLARLGYRQAEAVSEAPRFDLEGWEYLDDHHLILGSSGGRPYLVAFDRPCRNLKFGNRIGYSTTAGMLTRLDRIISTDAGEIPQACLIGELYRLQRVPRRQAE